MRIMTLNIWGEYFGNPVPERIDDMENTIRKYDADILGIQEVCRIWYGSNFLERLSNKYIAILPFRGNYTVLLFKKDMFSVWEQGFKMYENTPVRQWKCVNWAVLIHKETGKRIGVINTHAWPGGSEEGEKIRESNGKELAATMHMIKEKYPGIPVVAFGDLNGGEEGALIKTLHENGIVSAYEVAEEFSEVSSHHGDPVRNPDGTWTGKRTENDKTKSLDHIVIFKDDIKIKKHHVVEDQEIINVTDHSPVYIDFDF